MTDTEALRRAIDWVKRGVFLAETGSGPAWNPRHGIPGDIILNAATRYLALAEGDEKIWWCEVHGSRGNHVLDDEWTAGRSLEMWGGCHDSLWSFAAGKGGGGKEEEVGRCRMVPRILAAITEEENESP